MTDRPTHCEECGEELHEYASEVHGVTGVGCDVCGWSWDDPKSEPVRQRKEKPVSTITLADVLTFLKTADDVDKTAIRAVLQTPFEPSTEGYSPKAHYNMNRQAVAKAVLSKIEPGNPVTFMHDGVRYEGTVQKINRLTATVKVTKITGTPRNSIVVGAPIRVSASILARN
jgi:hypothetical protein